MLMTRQRLWSAASMIALVVAMIADVSAPSAAASNRISLRSIVVASQGAAVVVTASYDCPAKEQPYAYMTISQNVGSGRIQSQYGYTDQMPRCSPQKRLTFTAIMPPPTYGESPQSSFNRPWRVAPLVLSISVDTSVLNRVVTPTAAPLSSKFIRSTGRIVARGAGAVLSLTVACGSPRQEHPAVGSVSVQLTQVVRGVAQTSYTGYPVLCDARAHAISATVASATMPWRAAPAFAVVAGSLFTYGDVRLTP
jgi:hypothetical protein